MSEHIVHTAILEDCFSLAGCSGRIDPGFKELMRKYRGFAKLGCITVSGDRFTFRLLEDMKLPWKSGKMGEMLEQKIAFVLGWVSHRAADRQMKPIWKEPKAMGKGTDADPSLSPTDCSVYHEGRIFREYYSDSDYKYAIFSDKLAGLRIAGTVKIGEAFGLIQPLVQRSLFERQTLEKEAADVHDWFEKLTLRMQHFYVDINRYVRSAAAPDPMKLAEYVDNIDFFAGDDLIIRAAQKIRKGEHVAPDELDAAVSHEPRSHYGRALKLAFNYVKAASDYYSTDMTIDELKEKLDIGKKGRDGSVV